MGHSMSQYVSKAEMLKAVMAENEQLRAQQGVQPDVRACIRAELENWHIESGDVSHYEALTDSLVSALKRTTHHTTQGLDASDKQWKETRLVGALGEMIAHVTWDGKNPPVFSVTRGKFVDSESRVLSGHAACHALGVFLQEHADTLAAQAKQGGAA